MAMRLSGLASNMDTDTIVKQLMEAQRTKLTKIENKKTKLEWSQDRWKDIQTKLYALYKDQTSNLSLQGNYSTKKATSSNETVVKATADSSAASGTHAIAIKQLATSQFITGGQLDSSVTGSTLLKDIPVGGMTVGSTIAIKDANNNEIGSLKIEATTKLSDFVSACKNAGLNASFDETQKRLFISSKSSGDNGAFSFTSYTGTVYSGKKAIMDTVASADKVAVNKAFTTIENKLSAMGATDVDREAYITDVLKNSKSDPANQDLIDAIKLIDSKKQTFITDDVISCLSDFSSVNRTTTDLSKLKLDGSATTVPAKNCIYEYNGVEMTSASNKIVVNGLTLEALNVSQIDVPSDGITPATYKTTSVNVSNDIDATYKKVKDFLTKYNEILKQMNEAYYADSARGYEPLTDDEKEAMTDDQITKWEDKIKKSVLRRDTTLGGIISSMKQAMNTSVAVNGKNYSLSSFGIMTSTDYSEKGLLHIYGDKEDSTYSDKSDKLKKALEENPDAVIQTLSGIVGNLHKTLVKKMSKTELSSALTFYNDKDIKERIDDYKDDISKMEDKLSDMENKYYKQFTAMEKAMASLQSQQSALAGLLGSK